MSYYPSGNIPPPEKVGMFPPGAYPPSVSPVAGSYMPGQSGLPSQPGCAPMSQGYPAPFPGYPSSSNYPSQPGYPSATAPGPSMGYASPGMRTPSYPASQGYPPGSMGYLPSGAITPQSPYPSAPGLPGTNPLYPQGSPSPYSAMPMPAGRGYPMGPGSQMYPGAAYPSPYAATSPYGPPYP